MVRYCHLRGELVTRLSLGRCGAVAGSSVANTSSLVRAEQAFVAVRAQVREVLKHYSGDEDSSSAVSKHGAW